jgi:hypothetical protein
MTLKINYGGPEPIIIRGANQCRLFEFSYQNPGWHSFKNDRATREAIKGLESRGHIYVKGNQFINFASASRSIEFWKEVLRYFEESGWDYLCDCSDVFRDAFENSAFVTHSFSLVNNWRKEVFSFRPVLEYCILICLSDYPKPCSNRTLRLQFLNWVIKKLKNEK